MYNLMKAKEIIFKYNTEAMQIEYNPQVPAIAVTGGTFKLTVISDGIKLIIAQNATLRRMSLKEFNDIIEKLLKGEKLKDL